jgi:hypothetical protein
MVDDIAPPTPAFLPKSAESPENKRFEFCIDAKKRRKAQKSKRKGFDTEGTEFAQRRKRRWTTGGLAEVE